MNVSLHSNDEMAELIRNRTHWIIVFGRDACDLIDLIDVGIGADPTYPTAMVPSRYGVFMMTIIPKERVPRRTIVKAIRQATSFTGDAAPDQDIFILSNEDEGPGVAAYLTELIGDTRCC
jgi:hypothetical protein